MSPGVETAVCTPQISRNGCKSFGRGAPNSRSQASEPTPMMQDNCPSRSRKPTPRSRLDRSAHNPRTVASAPAPGLIVTTRKIADRVNLATTGCDTTNDTQSSSIRTTCKPAHRHDVKATHPNSAGHCLKIAASSPVRAPSAQSIFRNACPSAATSFTTSGGRRSCAAVPSKSQSALSARSGRPAPLWT